MLRKIMLIAVAGLFASGMSRLSFAMMGGDHSGSRQMAQAHTEHGHGTVGVVKEAGFSEQAVNIGNKICPVSGEKVGQGGMESATYEYKGKIYNFCCASCIDDFRKDPGKYIKKVEQELQVELEEQTEHKEHEMGMMQESGTSHQGMH